MTVRTLYLTRNGLLEPLGQSQVLAYLRGLSQDYRITLITYEKPEDLADASRMCEAHNECEALGIQWFPQRFKTRRSLIAPALSLLRMTWLAWRLARRGEAQLIHARSYIPACGAWFVWRLTGTPFIFDMRALWPEEMITDGRLKRDSVLHKTLTALERVCLRDAAAVVSLTHVGVDYLRTSFPREMANQTVVVIPTCADLNRFVPATRPPDRRVIGCLGTVLSGWFQLDWLVAFLGVAVRRDPQILFELTTRDDPDRVRAAFGNSPELLDRMRIAPCPSDRVQEILQRQCASVMFYAGGQISELGRSPTRMAEILACGLPLVANDGVGDVARIILDYHVGVLAIGPGSQEMEAAWDALEVLLADPNLAARCRRAAEEIFSLDSGTAAYARLYASTLAERDPRTIKR